MAIAAKFKNHPRKTTKRKTEQATSKSSKEPRADRKSVGPGVQATDKKRRALEMREQYFELCKPALETLRRGLVEKGDVRLAHEILLRCGAVPTEMDVQAILREPDEGTEAARVKAEMLKLVNVAYDRAKIFGGPVPSVSDVVGYKEPSGDDAGVDSSGSGAD